MGCGTSVAKVAAEPSKSPAVSYLESTRVVTIGTSGLCREHFTFHKLLGEGGYGSVYLASLNEQGRVARPSIGLDVMVAIKVVKKSRKTTRHQSCLHKERQLMARLNYPFVTKLFCAFQDYSHMYLVQEYASGGDLHSLVRKMPGKRMEERLARHMIACVILGLGYLHTKGFLHSDIKPSNILLSPDGRALLCDFGLVMEWQKPQYRNGKHSYRGTRSYMAPEKLHRLASCPGSDFYSLGVTLFRLLTGKLPYNPRCKDTLKWLRSCLKLKVDNETSISAQRKKIRALQRQSAPPGIALYSSEVDEFLGDSARSLIENLMICNPTYRLGNGKMSEVLGHRWFQDTNWVDLRQGKFDPEIRTFSRESTKPVSPHDSSPLSLGTVPSLSIGDEEIAYSFNIAGFEYNNSITGTLDLSDLPSFPSKTGKPLNPFMSTGSPRDAPPTLW